jgi:hypothetical protein
MYRSVSVYLVTAVFEPNSIALQTFVECVRVRTFGRYGLQQIQVDTHYLQLYLWRFVNDEKLVFRSCFLYLLFSVGSLLRGTLITLMQARTDPIYMFVVITV